eukprot:c11368_g1_i3.p1 GENE.c11368_g1_i3~~c11368_g1_i3.p1  ORF type:complete len:173 (+),score=53.18 c11368_g1_i3:308-826(+)
MVFMEYAIVCSCVAAAAAAVCICCWIEQLLASQFRTVDVPLRPYRLIKLVVGAMRYPVESFFLMCLTHGPYSETWVNKDVFLHFTHHDDGQPCENPPCVIKQSRDSNTLAKSLSDPMRLFGGLWDQNDTDSMQAAAQVTTLTTSSSTLLPQKTTTTDLPLTANDNINSKAPR